MPRIIDGSVTLSTTSTPVPPIVDLSQVRNTREPVSPLDDPIFVGDLRKQFPIGQEVKIIWERGASRKCTSDARGSQDKPGACHCVC